MHWFADHLPAGTFGPPQLQLQFLNSKQGWVSESEGGATGTEPLTLYRTVNGGATWDSALSVSPTSNSPIPLQGSKSFTFRSPKYGWITGGNYLQSGDLYLFSTGHGGMNWHKQVPLHDHFPKDALLQTWTPSFAGERGLLPVTWLPEIPHTQRGVIAIAVLKTNDGGKQWIDASHTLLLPLTSSPPVMSTWGGQYIWVRARSGHLAASINAGRSWVDMRTRGLPNTIENIDFVNAKDGWAWSGTQHDLWITRNGGRIWTSIPSVLLSPSR